MPTKVKSLHCYLNTGVCQLSLYCFYKCLCSHTYCITCHAIDISFCIYGHYSDLPGLDVYMFSLVCLSGYRCAYGVQHIDRWLGFVLTMLLIIFCSFLLHCGHVCLRFLWKFLNLFNSSVAIKCSLVCYPTNLSARILWNEREMYLNINSDWLLLRIWAKKRYTNNRIHVKFFPIFTFYTVTTINIQTFMR